MPSKLAAQAAVHNMTITQYVFFVWNQNGKSAERTAELLHISLNTVYYHVRKLRWRGSNIWEPDLEQRREVYKWLQMGLALSDIARKTSLDYQKLRRWLKRDGWIAKKVKGNIWLWQRPKI